MITNDTKINYAKMFLERNDWRDTERGWTHPDHPDEFCTLEQAYRYELGLAMFSINVTKGDA